MNSDRGRARQGARLRRPLTGQRQGEHDMTVSVIMPSYNYASYLPEAVGSVLAQTYADIELIVVDDGSTDDTPDVLGKIADPRLKTIRIPNSGVSVARNTGLDAARGECIAFLDADDRWLPAKLEKQMRLLEAEPSVGLVFTDFARFDAAGVYPETLFDYVPDLAAIPRRPAQAAEGYVITADTFTALAGTAEMATWLVTVLVRADAVRDLRFPAGIALCEDYQYMLKVYERVQAAYLEEPLVEVRRHGSNSYNSSAQMLEPRVAAIATVLNETGNRRHRKVLRRGLGRAWAAAGYRAFWNGNVRDSTRAYFQALKYRGSTWNALKHILLLPLLPVIHRRYPKRGGG